MCVNLVTFTCLFVGEFCRYKYIVLLSCFIKMCSNVWLNYMLKVDWDIVQLDHQQWGQLRIFQL
jgi:hypothetical protein